MCTLFAVTQTNEPDVGILLFSSLIRLDYFRVIVMFSLKRSAGTTPWSGPLTKRKAPHIPNTG